jgi:hypothetical protein
MFVTTAKGKFELSVRGRNDCVVEALQKIIRTKMENYDFSFVGDGCPGNAEPPAVMPKRLADQTSGKGGCCGHKTPAMKEYH